MAALSFRGSGGIAFGYHLSYHPLLFSRKNPSHHTSRTALVPEVPCSQDTPSQTPHLLSTVGPCPHIAHIRRSSYHLDLVTTYGTHPCSERYATVPVGVITIEGSTKELPCVLV